MPLSKFLTILPSHLRLGLPSGLFTSGFFTETLYGISPRPHICYMPQPPHSSWFDQLKNIWWGVDVARQHAETPKGYFGAPIFCLIVILFICISYLLYLALWTSPWFMRWF
jgi:hypothetical protein